WGADAGGWCGEGEARSRDRTSRGAARASGVVRKARLSAVSFTAEPHRRRYRVWRRLREVFARVRRRASAFASPLAVYGDVPPPGIGGKVARPRGVLQQCRRGGRVDRDSVAFAGVESRKSSGSRPDQRGGPLLCVATGILENRPTNRSPVATARA